MMTTTTTTHVWFRWNWRLTVEWIPTDSTVQWKKNACEVSDDGMLLKAFIESSWVELSRFELSSCLSADSHVWVSTWICLQPSSLRVSRRSFVMITCLSHSILNGFHAFLRMEFYLGQQERQELRFFLCLTEFQFGWKVCLYFRENNF